MKDAGANQLKAWVRSGMNNRDASAWQNALGVRADASDREIACALIAAAAEQDLKNVGIGPGGKTDPRSSDEDEAIATADTSLLGQLGSEQEIASIDNVHTLLAILRGGTLIQRRAALRALGERIASRGLSGDILREVANSVTQVRDVDLAYERSTVRNHFPGAIGRHARAENDEWSALTVVLEQSIQQFWDSELATEPVAALPGNQRASLLLRTRDLPDLILEHMSAVIEGADGVADRSARLAMIASLRYAGDPRLVPALRVALEEGGEYLVEAAQTLGRIDDPRVRPALRSMFDRTMVEPQRTALAGALALVGDYRGASYCRSLLDSHESTVLISALEALAAAGGAEDCERVVQLLGHDDAAVMTAAVKTLARVGDGRALRTLYDLQHTTRVSGLIADIDDARTAIIARMELRGEELPEETESVALERASLSPVDPHRPSARIRLRSLWNLWWGHFWYILGGVSRAIGRYERASEGRPGWFAPMIRIAIAHSREHRYPQALVAFRRALEIDRRRVEQNPGTMNKLASTFLRRAEEMERDGRNDIARGLIEELHALDLRRATGPQRMEAKMKFEAQRRRLHS